MAKTQEGKEIATICMHSAGQLMKDILNEPLHCICCEALFSPSKLPETFVVLIPIKHDPKDLPRILRCSKCNKNDNRWILDNGPKREGPLTTTRRLEDKTH